MSRAWVCLQLMVLISELCAAQLCSNSDNCDRRATCSDTNSSFICACNAGYAGDGTAGNCVNVDECSQLDAACDMHANCTDTDGSFFCTCKLGYKAEGVSCQDEDECNGATFSPCDEDATCRNTAGSFTCACNTGYSGDGTRGSCTDINECAGTANGVSRACDANAACTNSPGSFSCACNVGYARNGSSCLDIDECQAQTTCDGEATCRNTAGSFTCACNAGYSGGGLRGSCQDIDECAVSVTNGIACDANAACTNTAGSFSCVCKRGYEGDGMSCGDMQECLFDLHDCAAAAECVNTEGSFECTCLEGFTGNGRECSNINECIAMDGNTASQSPCHSQATCFDTDGSFECECDDGFVGTGLYCSAADTMSCPDEVVVLTDREGSIEFWSPDGAYAPNLDCVWRIVPPGASAIDLTIEEMDTEIDFDLIHIYTCSEGECESDLSEPRTRSGFEGEWFSFQTPGVQVSFFSDESSTGRGFIISYRAVGIRSPKCPATASAGLRQVSPTGSGVVGIDFWHADGYPGMQHCRWVIQLLTGFAELRFPAFLTERGYDFVKVYECQDHDSTCSAPIERKALSGMVHSNVTFLFEASTLLVEFESDYDVSSSGFRAVFSRCMECVQTSSCPRNRLQSEDRGEIVFDFGAQGYGEYRTCSWVINPPAGQGAILLDFVQFETEADHDWVSIFACSDEECQSPGSVITRYSGTNGSEAYPEGSVTLTAPSVKVLFESDGSTSARGFVARWSSIDMSADVDTNARCSPLSFRTELVSDVVYLPQDGYTNNQECRWILSPTVGARSQAEAIPFPPFLTSGIVLRDQAGRTLKADPETDVLRLDEGDELSFAVLYPALGDKLHNFTGTEFVALRVDDQDTFLSHDGWETYLEGESTLLDDTGPAGEFAAKYAWRFVESGQNTFKIMNNFDGGRWLGYDSDSDRVLVVDVDESHAMRFTIDGDPTLEAVPVLGFELNFTSFATEKDFDTVEVRSCEDRGCEHSEELFRFSGNLTANMARLVFEAGIVEVVFTSDHSETRSGFAFGWKGLPFRPHAVGPEAWYGCYEQESGCPTMDCCRDHNSVCLHGECATCPVGAVCFHGEFLRGRFAGESWVLDKEDNEYKLQHCPPRGFERLPSEDHDDVSHETQCLPCGMGRYLLHQDGGCQECPIGAVCDCDESDPDNPGVVICELLKDYVLVNGQRRFHQGSWVPDGSAYRLVSCPRGTELLRAMHNGSQADIEGKNQACRQCLDGEEYILDPNHYTVEDESGTFYVQHQECQPCPIGAVCERGLFVRGRDGSEWSASEDKGIIILHGCPAGFELTNETRGVDGSFAFDAQKQHCRRCGSGFYIINSDLHQCNPCPAGGQCDGTRLTAAVGEEWIANASTGEYQLRSCPPGHLLVNQSEKGLFDVTVQQCRPCEREGEYIEDPNKGFKVSDSCIACPVGGRCSHGLFVPRVAGSQWEVDPDGLRRVVHCPAGFVLVRDANQSSFDDCVECGPTTYLLEGDWNVSKTADAARMCLPCPRGATCPGGSRVYPEKGWWRNIAHEGAARRADAASGPQALVFQCPPSLCVGNNTCRDGHLEGSPLCGICSQGWTRSGNGECVHCGEGESRQAKLVVVYVAFAVVGVVLFYLFSLRPLVNPFIAERMKFMQCFSVFARRDKNRWLAKVSRQLQGIFKIVVTAFQVSSSFLNTFRVDWPVQFSEVMAAFWFVNFDILRLEGTACITENWSYQELLLVKMVIPVLLLCVLALPWLFVTLAGWKKNLKFVAPDADGVRVTLHRIYTDTADQCWYAGVLLLFLIFPSTSVTALQAFHCEWVGDPSGLSLLAADYREYCPTHDKTGVIYICSVIATLVYPVGLPLALYAVLEAFEVPALSRDLRNSAKLRALLDHLGVINHVDYRACFFQNLIRNLGTAEAKECTDSTLTKRLHAKSELLMSQSSSGRSLRCSTEEMEALLDHDKLQELAKQCRKHFLSLGTAAEDAQEYDDSDAALRAKIKALTRKGGCGHEEVLDLVDFLLEHERLALPALGWLQEDDDEGDDDDSEHQGQNMPKLPARKSFMQRVEGFVQSVLTPTAVTFFSDHHFQFVKRRALNRVGFLFDTYEVQYYYFEMLEMMRKLLMTSILVFMYPGTPAQLAAAILLSLCFLVLFMHFRPYLDPSLDFLQFTTQMAQTCTLLYGIMTYMKEELVDVGASDDAGVVGWVVTFLNLFCIIWPFVRFIMRPRVAVSETRQCFFSLFKTVHFAPDASLKNADLAEEKEAGDPCSQETATEVIQSTLNRLERLIVSGRVSVEEVAAMADRAEGRASHKTDRELRLELCKVASEGRLYQVLADIGYVNDRPAAMELNVSINEDLAGPAFASPAASPVHPSSPGLVSVHNRSLLRAKPASIQIEPEEGEVDPRERGVGGEDGKRSNLSDVDVRGSEGAVPGFPEITAASSSEHLLGQGHRR